MATFRTHARGRAACNAAPGWLRPPGFDFTLNYGTAGEAPATRGRPRHRPAEAAARPQVARVRQAPGLRTRQAPTSTAGTSSARLPSAADAGPHGDGGSAAWLCQPGTTLCDPSGEIGSCFECASDGDCANQVASGLRRPSPALRPAIRRCRATRSFCQECVDNADCAGNPAGPLCDLNPEFHPPGALVSDLEIGRLRGLRRSDHRLSPRRLGPVCDGPNQVCDELRRRPVCHPAEQLHHRRRLRRVALLLSPHPVLPGRGLLQARALEGCARRSSRGVARERRLRKSRRRPGRG